MIKDYFSLAFGNLKHRGLRSWLTMLGIFIGIAAVVSLISLGAGLQEAVTGQFATLDADKLIVENIGTGFGPPGSTVIEKLTTDDLRLLESINGVEEAIPRIIRVVEIEYNKISKFRYITNVRNNQDHNDVIIDSSNIILDQGRFLDPGEKGKVVLGDDFLDDTFEKDIRLGSRIKIQGEYFEVVGFLERGNSFQINSVIWMAEEDLQEILNIDKDEVDTIIVQIQDPDRIEETAKEIARKLRRDRNQKLGEEDFSVQTPLQAVGAVNTVLDIINLIVSGIAAISLLIGGVGIANTMFTSVIERTKEIGIMKSIGAKNKDIMAVFIIESALLGLVGGIIGSIIGLALAFLASSAASAVLGGLELKVAISYPLIIAAISFSLLIGLFSGLVPAYQASKLNPVEALRK